MERYRVVSWGTGPVGAETLAAIIAHPNLDLVGVRVYSPEKVGRDAGSLVSLPPTGVLATDDVDQLLKLNPDCVCYTASDLFGLEPVVDDLCRILAAGINVVDATITPLAFPDMLAPIRDRIEAACEEGGSTFYYGGINPGFGLDLLPALAASGARRIDSIELSEYFDASSYKTGDLLKAVGFSLTPEEDKDTVQVEAFAGLWAPAANLVATAFGQQVSDMTVAREVVLAEEEFTSNGLTVKPGTITAMRVVLGFVIGDRERITYREYLRLSPSLDSPWPSDWPSPPGGIGGHRITINGAPTITVELSADPGPEDPRFAAGDGLGGIFLFTGARLANAVPVVCASQPGYYTPISLGSNIFGKPNWS